MDSHKNNMPLFKTANDEIDSVIRMKNKNTYFFFDSDKKKTDLSVKPKDILIYSDNNDENYGRTNKKLTTNKNERNNKIMVNRRKSSEIKLYKSNNNGITTDSSRFTPKNLKLPKIYLNDKEKRNNNFLSQYSDDIKRSVEIHKSSIVSRKNHK